jgi:uncharacterized membrane protein
MADMITTIFGFMRIILGFLLVLFIPGFAISFLFYPRSGDISAITRIALSIIISLGSTLCILLFFDIFLGVNMKVVNITLALIAFSALLCMILAIRQAVYFITEKKRSDDPKVP